MSEKADEHPGRVSKKASSEAGVGTGLPKEGGGEALFSLPQGGAELQRGKLGAKELRVPVRVRVLTHAGTCTQRRDGEAPFQNARPRVDSPSSGHAGVGLEQEEGEQRWGPQS